MTAKGTARVQIEALRPGDPELAGARQPQTVKSEEPPSLAAVGGTKIYVQVGAFGDSANAARMEKQLRQQGFSPVVRSNAVNGRTIYRVRIGPLRNDAAFDATMTRLRELHYADAHLALE
jgi:cell division protein FtsN